jgi:hypothetical protein
MLDLRCCKSPEPARCSEFFSSCKLLQARDEFNMKLILVAFRDPLSLSIYGVVADISEISGEGTISRPQIRLDRTGLAKIIT